MATVRPPELAALAAWALRSCAGVLALAEGVAVCGTTPAVSTSTLAEQLATVAVRDAEQTRLACIFGAASAVGATATTVERSRDAVPRADSTVLLVMFCSSAGVLDRPRAGVRDRRPDRRRRLAM